jgi:uncharacterized protein YukE
MTMQGMDVSAVQALSQQMSSAASEIQSQMQRLTSSLESVQWVGNDANQFKSDWQQHQANLNQVVQCLQEASQTAQKNAQQQEQASSS